MPRPKLPTGQTRVRPCISLPKELLDRLDALYHNRSAIIEQLIRDHLKNRESRLLPPVERKVWP